MKSHMNCEFSPLLCEKQSRILNYEGAEKKMPGNFLRYWLETDLALMTMIIPNIKQKVKSDRWTGKKYFTIYMTFSTIKKLLVLKKF